MSLITQLKERYDSLEKREQHITIIGAIAICFFIIFSLIYRPMSQSINQLETSNLKNQELLAWMAQSAATIKGNNSSGSSSNKRAGRSMNVIINTSASKAKINISRSQPRDNNQYQIWLDKVYFNDLLLWLNELQTDYGIYISMINLSSTSTQGEVRVNLTFQDTGS